jgi:transcriptional regulator GlxA family with amidase domain
MLRLRIERAKRELAHMDMPIKQVAWQSGFSDAKRLHEAFTRELGMSPSQYRQSLRLLGLDEAGERSLAAP